ncbi:Phosphatidylglycerophosphate synthase [Brevibacterium siliguriense]|uniref:Phosphatidylglycerophosphate synthase n=1 Tax=Brevibacterium siliguriense TaxID=1136497 RepID=A0A1H1W1F2_9MICO|nr:CDP-alcohol phosphatidyltransferase family protein [Brevibacterium siliguriense]SDS90531.1 Phosphatidylglycerophosphate synthase [Brevibacterium siliguriense]
MTQSRTDAASTVSGTDTGVPGIGTGPLTGAVRSGTVAASLLAASAIASVILNPAVVTVLAAAAVTAIGVGPRLRRGRPWTPADTVTACRLALIVVCTCQIIHSPPGLNWSAVIIGALALALDGVDGFVARRTQITEAGAGFDETVDALFVLILALALVPLWGWWTALPGLYYYVFRCITAFRLRWQQRLPFSQMRKVVAAAQGILLITAGSPLAQAHEWVGFGAAGLALASLTWSFGRDIIWLERHAR